jgi:hypothetical protein
MADNDDRGLPTMNEGQPGKFDLRHEETVAALQPVRKLLGFVLLLAVKDGASEVRFEPLTPGDVLGPGCRVRYCVGRTWYDMVPAPVPVQALSREVAALSRQGFIHRWLAALRGGRPRPLESRLRLLVGGKKIEVLAFLGSPLVFHLSPGDAAQEARGVLERVLELYPAGEVIP